ncbi:MAG TPA: hypothetical protein VM261_28895 [Kofleriaceae bacterium]|nr:hypothetical protein [Kofleriaceae bacterium]
MFIIWGTHHYGHLGGHGNSEHLVTKFGHLYWFPIFPMESLWVTHRLGDQRVGIDVPLSARSVLATYLRFWAPLVALGAGATLSIAGLAIAAVMVALSAWSWTWMRRRTGRERRRAQLNQLAFETACDPLIRREGDCLSLRREIDARFAEVSNGRTPDDVARLGADTPQQAALAYASLRLVAATTRGGTARKAREASERVLDRLTDREADAMGDGGPYRAQPAAATLAADLDAATARAVQEQDRAFADALVAARASAPPPQQRSRFGVDLTYKGWILVGLGVAALLGFGGYKAYQDHIAAKQAIAELRAFTDELCDCPTKRCAQEVVTARLDDLERLEKVAREGIWTDDDVEDLGRRAERCLVEKAALPD